MRQPHILGDAGVTDEVRRLRDRFRYPDELGGSDDAVVSVASEAGAAITLSRSTNQSIANGGEAVSWSAFNSRYVFQEPSLPVTVVTIPTTGYYNVGVYLEWDTFTAGGEVAVVRVRDSIDYTVWPPDDVSTIWTATDGRIFEDTAHNLRLKVGDTLRLDVDHNDASAQNLAEAVMAVYLVDRSVVNQDYAAAVIRAAPLAYWRLDETTGGTAADSAGHASGPFNGTYTNSPDLNQPGVMLDGSGSPSVNLDGVNEYIAGADWSDMDFVSGSFSIECWFRADALDGVTQQLIEKRDHGAAPQSGWEFGVTSAFVFFQDDSAGVVQSGALSNDTIYHAVITSDQTTTLLYLNGVQVDSDSGSIAITANAQVVSIGYDTAAPGFAFDGRLDEIAVYDRVLTVNEVVEHYEIGKGTF